MTANPQDLDALVHDLSRGRPCAEEGGEKCKVMDERSGCYCAMAANAITTLRRDLRAAEAALAREVWGLCEIAEDQASAKLKGDLTDYECGYYRGQKITAKNIRRAIQITPEATSALDAVKRAEYARGIRDTLAYLRRTGLAGDVDDDPLSSCILAMIPEGM
jgi:hypothetical protein